MQRLRTECPECIEEALISFHHHFNKLLLEALGEPPKDTNYSNDINPNLALLMETIIEKGLTKVEKEKFASKFQITASY